MSAPREAVVAAYVRLMLLPRGVLPDRGAPSEAAVAPRRAPARVQHIDCENQDAGQPDGINLVEIGVPQHIDCENQDAVVLASSPVCRVQAMRVDERARSMQYHLEVEDDTVRNWGEIPAYRQALESTLGPGSIEPLAADADRHMDGFVSDAQQLYRNFMSAARSADV